MQVRELFSIEALSRFQLLAGHGGLDNKMKDVVLLEYESLSQQTPNYYDEDFIVTTLFYAKDDPELLLPVVERLIGLGAAGLAVKSVYYNTLPESVINLANSRNFPLFLFDTMYVEDVILKISDYIRLRQEFSMFEEPIHRILTGNYESAEVERFCAQMNPGRRKYMCGVFLHGSDPDNDWFLNLQDTLRMRSARDITAGYQFLQFRRGFFILCNSTDLPQTSAVLSACRDILGQLGCAPQGLRFGISRVHQHASGFDCVIREAFDALTYALAFSSDSVDYNTTGTHRLIFPTLRDKSAVNAVQSLTGRLEQYDRDNGTGCLTQTLQTYTVNGYSIAATAAALSQHQNTIRYRLKKIGELMDCGNDADHAVYLLGEYLRLAAIWEMIF